MRTVSDIHNLALATPAYYGRQNAGKDMSGVLAAAEKTLLEQADPNDYYRQLQAMLGHDVFRSIRRRQEACGGGDPRKGHGDRRQPGPHG